MAWLYNQKTGILSHKGDIVAHAYSGHGNGKNNPAMQEVHNVGPLPVGRYTIGAPKDTVTHGPYVLTLTPDSHNRMFGRAGFLMHGDSVVEPGTASLGCVIAPHAVRVQVWESGDDSLDVISGLDPLPSEVRAV